MSTHPPTGRRRSFWPFILAAFLVTPIVEIYLIVLVGRQIGVLPTLLLVILTAVLGTMLIRREGSRAFSALREAIAAGRVPGKELADGALILIGGTLMLTPGFVTDTIALLLILPVTRPVFRGALTRAITARLIVGVPGQPPPRRGRPRGSGPVVEGEVVDPDD